MKALFFLRLAWRNLFRNKRRTAIASLAIGIGLAALIFTDAFMLGMKNNMIHSATASFLGEGQVHAPGFRTSFDPEMTVRDPDAVVRRLRDEPLISHFSARAAGSGMATSPAEARPVVVYGIDPATERDLSQIDDTIREGTYFRGDEGTDLVLGAKLAKNLQASLGDRVVITLSKAGSGEISQDLFRITGIYEFGIPELDGGMAFIRLDKARRLLGIGEGIHEIALKFGDARNALRKDLPVWKDLAGTGNEALSWAELLPQLKAVFDMTAVFLAVTGLILFGVVTFGIVNTLFMSFYERMFEFGVIRAVGTRPSAVRRLIVFEAGGLALISLALGAVLGFALTFLSTRTGIDYRGIEFAGATVRDLIYPEMKAAQFMVYPAAVFLFTLFVSLYPAHVAGKLRPAEAIRRSL
jgi:ABC-type lipoprotein release transport system permease subunit